MYIYTYTQIFMVDFKLWKLKTHFNKKSRPLFLLIALASMRKSLSLEK